MENKYYICSECGTLMSEDDILEDCSNGGTDMCGCMFGQAYWDNDLYEPDYDYPRIYIKYTEITKEQYIWLIGEENEAIRLKMFKTID